MKINMSTASKPTSLALVASPAEGAPKPINRQVLLPQMKIHLSGQGAIC